MAYKISDECIMCGTCEGECPVGAIAEGEGKYEIDADACIECGSCAYACPGHLPLVERFRAGNTLLKEAKKA